MSAPVMAVTVAAPEAPEVQRVQWARPWVTLTVGLAVPFVCAATLSEFANTVVVQAAIAVLTVAGLHVLVHWAGQISLAQVALMGVGAFVTARANADFSVPLPGAILLGALGAVVASLAIGLPALRIRGLALAITTLAFGFAASRWLFLQTWLVPQVSGIPLRDQTLFGFDITQSRQLVIPVGVVCVAVVALTARLGGSHGATWIRPYQAGGLSGLGVTHTLRESMTDIPRPSSRRPPPAATAAWRRHQAS